MSTSARDFLLELIEKYKQHECLWQVRHNDYRDKTKRNYALDDILILFRTRDPSANRETVLKKLQTLRGSYNKELRKVKASCASGSNSESVHVPKLWYYNHLSFLQDQHLSRNSKMTSSMLDLLFDEDESVYSIEDASSPGVSHSPVPRPTYKQPPPKVDLLLEKFANHMDTPNPISTPAEKQKQEHDAFGEYVSEKLRSMPKSMVPYCQKLINDAIFFGEIDSLNLSSRIVTDKTLDPSTTAQPSPR